VVVDRRIRSFLAARMRWMALIKVVLHGPRPTCDQQQLGGQRLPHSRLLGVRQLDAQACCIQWMALEAWIVPQGGAPWFRPRSAVAIAGCSNGSSSPAAGCR
jgi:hypothetical protein